MCWRQEENWYIGETIGSGEGGKRIVIAEIRENEWIWIEKNIDGNWEIRLGDFITARRTGLFLVDTLVLIKIEI